MTKRTATGGRRRSAFVIAAVVALLVQLIAIYSPGSPEGNGVFGADKLVHVVLFAVPSALAVLGGGRLARWVPLLLLGHAVVSELVQAWWIPSRSGDVYDVLADVVGVALGCAIGRRLRPAGDSATHAET